MKTLIELSKALGAGATTSRALTESALARAEDKEGEGGRAFTRVYRETALAEAEASDRLRSAGIVPSPLAGLPISIKDLFDVAGETTLAGSVVLKGRPAAKADAPIVARLRAAGAVIVGRTNMTEFAYSGLGLNPHYGTPLNPWDRATGRIPGGSSSGAAISVTDDMAAAAIGTDTGGSIRIPSALCGLTGFKPTARRVPREGGFPLSYTLDSIGPLARSVACCALVDAILAGEAPEIPAALPLAGLRFGAPQRFVLDGMDETVAKTYAGALSRLSKAGARIVDIPMAELEEIPAVNAKGGFPGAEAYAIHRPILAEAADAYDPRVLVRIQRGSRQDAADYIDLLQARRDLIARTDAASAPFDALVLPTVPVIPPALEPLERDDDLYGRANILILRNPSVGNFLDRCALSLPVHAPGEAPVGLMLMGEHGADRRLLSIGLAVESAFAAPG